jgi:hypothetical protein
VKGKGLTETYRGGGGPPIRQKKEKDLEAGADLPFQEVPCRGEAGESLQEAGAGHPFPQGPYRGAAGESLQEEEEAFLHRHTQHMSAYVSIRQHTSAYASIVRIRQHTSEYASICQRGAGKPSRRRRHSAHLWMIMCKNLVIFFWNFVYCVRA